MPVIDLSPGMKVRVGEWGRQGHQLDIKLLFECAYYPRGGCQNCSWDKPNPKCPYSHILIDTRIGGAPIPPQRVVKVKKSERKFWKELWEGLTPQLREEIEKVLEGR